MKKFLISLLLISSALTLTGCSLFNKTEEVEAKISSIQEESDEAKKSMARMIMAMEKRLSKLEAISKRPVAQTASTDIREIRDTLTILDKNMQVMDQNLSNLRNNMDVLAESLDASSKKQQELIEAYNNIVN